MVVCYCEATPVLVVSQGTCVCVCCIFEATPVLVVSEGELVVFYFEATPVLVVSQWTCVCFILRLPSFGGFSSEMCVCVLY